MRSLILLITALFLCLAGFSFAQDVPRAELFLGYPLPVGIHISAAVNIIRSISIVGEYWYSIAEYYHEWALQRVVAGPRLSLRSKSRWTPFVHALFGVAGAGESHWYVTSFATVLGGGVDVRVGRNVSIRAIQADFILTNFRGGSQNYPGLSFGLTFHLGKM
jgi:hypothetical protein